jgi:hypothetical protein
MLITSRPASADLISYQLSVAATTGPLAGQTSSGTVTFDSGIVPPSGGRVVGQHLFSDVEFTWDNLSYDARNTETSSFQFDSGGRLTQWDFGTACIPNGGSCVVRLPGGVPGFVDWRVLNDSTRPFFFEYGRSDQSFGFGTATLTPTLTATPEPITAGMLAMGLCGVYVRVKARRDYSNREARRKTNELPLGK